MVGFLGIPELYDGQFDSQTQLLVSGGDDSAALIREASSALDTFSPRLDRDFADLAAFDCRERTSDVSLLLGDSTLDWGLPVVYLGAGIVAPCSTGDIDEAARYGTLPADNTVWYLGGCNYSRSERDWARNTQRLLPIHELDLEVALHSAISELAGQPFHLMVNMDIFAVSWAPAVKRTSLFGLQPGQFWRAMSALQGAPVSMVQVCGLVADHPGSSSTARLAAEAARDLAICCFLSRGA